MKKILIVLVILASCSKNVPQPQPNNQNQNNNGNNPTPVKQDSKLLGKWIVDSTLVGIAKYTLNPTCELGDSMLVTSARIFPYEWTGIYLMQYGTWNNPYNDSLFVYNLIATQIHYSFKYTVTSNNLILKRPSTSNIESETIWYHKGK